MKSILFLICTLLSLFPASAAIRAQRTSPILHSIFDKKTNTPWNAWQFADPAAPPVHKKEKSPGTNVCIVGGVILGIGVLGLGSYMAFRDPNAYISPEMLLWFFGSIVTMIVGVIVVVTGAAITSSYRFKKKDAPFE